MASKPCLGCGSRRCLGCIELRADGEKPSRGNGRGRGSHCWDPCEPCQPQCPQLPCPTYPQYPSCPPYYPPPCPPFLPQCQPSCPVYLTAMYGNNQTPLPAQMTTLAFSNVVAASGPTGWMFYNPVTGVFTVPQDGAGFYNLTAHIGLNAPSEHQDTDVLIEMKVNGNTIVKSSDVFKSDTSSRWYDLTINYPLSVGQSVTVTVTVSNAGVLVPDPLSSFSLFMAFPV